MAQIQRPTREQLAKLPRRALVAYAVRAAWRAQVWTKDDLPEKERHNLIVALTAAMRFALAVNPEWELLADAASYASYASYAAASASASADDYDWLHNWAEQQFTDALMPLAFFQRRLWHDKTPEEVEECFKDWAQAQEDAGLKTVPAIYQALLQGTFKQQDLDELYRLLDAWWRKHPQYDGSLDQSQQEVERLNQALTSGDVHTQAEKRALQDRLQRGPLRKTLVNLLSRKEHESMTLALIGDWGVGKSSLIEQLIQALPTNRQKQPKLGAPEDVFYVVAEFNAWEYEKTDSMSAGLAQQVVRGLTQGLRFYQRWWLALRHAHLCHGWRLRCHLGVLCSQQRRWCKYQ